MKLSSYQTLKQSLFLSGNMRLAIDILAMSGEEIEALLGDEIRSNPLLDFVDSGLSPLGGESSLSYHNISQYEIAIKTQAKGLDFRESLQRQVGEERFNLMERQIANLIIENLDDDGLLLNHEEVYQYIVREIGVFPEWIDVVRYRIMDLDPIGCAARSHYETLKHQAKKKCKGTHEKFFFLLDSIHNDSRLGILRKRIRHTLCQESVEELKLLNCRPVWSLNNQKQDSACIFPDILVLGHEGKACVELLKRQADCLRTINIPHCPRLKKQEKESLRKNKKRAAFILRSLRFRENSLLSVAKAIVNHQHGWFFQNKQLVPLQLRSISLDTGLHESSISRIVRSKYLFCAKGTYELKYFFSNAIHNDEKLNAPCSKQVRDQIVKILKAENKTAPLSDQAIAKRLSDLNMAISRRTVAKYRSLLGIGSAFERKAAFPLA